MVGTNAYEVYVKTLVKNPNSDTTSWVFDSANQPKGQIFANTAEQARDRALLSLSDELQKQIDDGTAQLKVTPVATGF